MAESIDFAGIAARLLSQADTLVPSWLPAGRRRGHEWICGNLRGDAGESLSINLTNGKWGDFADDQLRGGDLISLYAALHNITQAKAARELNGDSNGRAVAHSTPPVSARVVPEEKPPAAPLDWPKPRPHSAWGDPAGIWEYYGPEIGAGPIFLVARYNKPEGGKEFLPYTWRGGKWAMKGYPTPRPLYRLRELNSRPGAPVLVVEGEKACDAARAYLLDYVVISWAGGAAGVKSSDWAPLTGRRVVIWPDADDPGAKAAAAIAAILLRSSTHPTVLKIPGTPTEGWDIADAIDEDWSTEQLVEFIRANGVVVTNIAEPASASESNVVDMGPIRRGRIHDREPPVSTQGSGFVRWAEMGLECNSGGVPHPTLSNASIVFRRHPDMAGKIWYDTFRSKVYHNIKGVERQWADHDDLEATAWLQQTVQLPKIGISIVRDAIVHAARQNQINSLLDWLEHLEWDGEERLTTWLADCLEVERSPYNDAIARNWAIAMVARAYIPGVKMDNMPVLEGKMGRGKSTFLEMLGAPWFASLPDEFGSKDFLQAIQGRWLIEVPDMTGFSKREHTHILAIITRRNDPYRATWGRHVEDHPRVSTFAATSETDDYLQDSRGIRRYWPVRCRGIDLSALEKQREQIFAEALIEFRKGTTWHEVPEADTAEEQRDRLTRDPWERRITEYIKGRREVQIEDILSDPVCINMIKERQTRREVLRVAAILRDVGWRKARPKAAGGKTYAAWCPVATAEGEYLDHGRVADDLDFNGRQE